MLTSITPLGERGRNSNWAVTAIAFAIGSLVAGALVGALAGAAGVLAGAWLPPGRIASTALAAAALGALALDLGVAGLRLPTIARQVNEDWLRTYRGWVYGVGFGFQLGLGLATVVTASAVYLALCAAVLTGSTLAGATIGLAFGAGRAAQLLLGASVHTPQQLHRLAARLLRWRLPAARLLASAQASSALLLLVVAWRA
jgi:sulfite exporter TauE/SafE